MCSADEAEGYGYGEAEIDPRGNRETSQEAPCSKEPADRPATENQDGQANEANRKMPWWGGAFGAVPEMRDNPEARGFYARRFCEIFFPDNIAGATEVSPGEVEIYFKFCL